MTPEPLYEPVVPLLAAAFAGALAWLAAAGALTVARWPEEPEAAPAAMDLGPEPPAVANLLTRGFAVTPDAVPATLLDLAARGAVEVEQVQPGRYVCRLRREAPEQLAPYERQLLDHLRAKAVEGVVPAGALTTGPQESSRSWWRRFRSAVVDDARARGLCRPMWPAGQAGAFATAVVGVATLAWAAHGFSALDEVVVTPLGVATGAALALMTAVAAWMVSTARQSSTPAGLAAGSRWLGVREQIEGSGIPGVGPDAVAVWDRYLSYGAALGVAAEAVRALPMGAESDRWAWSSVTGHWRQVRVRYPRRPGWGRHPAAATALGLCAAALAAGVVRLWGWIEGLGSPGVDLPPAADAGFAAAAGVLGAWAAFVLVRAVPDLVGRVEVTGEVLRARARAKLGSEEDAKRYYVAVDDGRTATVLAWSVRPALWSGVTQGQQVTAEVTPRLRYVRWIR